MDVDQLPETRRAIVLALKQAGSSTIAQLAERLRISGEAVRQQLLQLQRDGWVDALHEREPGTARAGRPAAVYRLTTAGDHLFRKNYDAIAVEMFDAVAEKMGPEGLNALLAGLTEARVREWAPRLEGLSIAQKIEALKNLYFAGDPFMTIESSPGGVFRLIERNCPYLNVARSRPQVCAVSVSLLARLLGVEVRREERFQLAHGRCIFRIDTNRQLPADAPVFAPELAAGI